VQLTLAKCRRCDTARASIKREASTEAARAVIDLPVWKQIWRSRKALIMELHRAVACFFAPDGE